MNVFWWIAGAWFAFCAVAQIVGFACDWPDFWQRVLKMKNSPKLLWAASTTVIAMAPLAVYAFVYAEPTKLPINEQAEKVAREFEKVRSALTSKPPSNDDEHKWYHDYLTGILPSQMEMACGKAECEEYRRFLKQVQAGSSNIHHQYSAIDIFVTKKRYIRSDTPLAGPDISVANDLTKPPAVDEAISQIQEKASPIAKASSAELTEPPKALKPNQIADATKPAIDPPPKEAPGAIPPTESEPHIAAKPELPPIVHQPTQLNIFLGKQAWVQCRKCGQKHQVGYASLVAHDHYICSNCSATMNTGPFSAKLIREMNRITESMVR